MLAHHPLVDLHSRIVALVIHYWVICLIVKTIFWKLKLNCTILSSFTVVRCFTLASIPNGAITYGPDMIPDYDVGTVATHSCNPGFRLLGSETRECLASGIWSGLIPVCLSTYKIL